MTGARAVVGCSKGLPQQSSPPSWAAALSTCFPLTSPVVPNRDTLALVLSRLTARGDLVLLAHPLCWAKTCTSRNRAEPHPA